MSKGYFAIETDSFTPLSKQYNVRVAQMDSDNMMADWYVHVCDCPCHPLKIIGSRIKKSLTLQKQIIKGISKPR